MFQNNFGGFYGTPYNNVWGQTPFVYNFGGNVPYNFGGNVGGNVPYNVGGNMPYNLGGNLPLNYGCNVGGQLGWGTLPFNCGTPVNTGNFGGFPTWNYNNTMGGNFGGQTFPGNQNFTPGFTNQTFGWPTYNGVGLTPFGCTTPNWL